MSKLKCAILTRMNALWASVLTALGFSMQSCGLYMPPVEPGFDEPVAMYGCPSADYVVIGQVNDEQGKPIADIEVKLSLNGSEVDTKTDSEGKFDIETNTFPQQTAVVVANDVDGEDNGAFESDTIKVTFVCDESNADGWYEGVYQAKDVNFTLKKVKEQPE